ncbi:hypothetical protein, partial [Actinobaculum sp. 352]|uniref:hypothetical protein n=1 Tax=Actinobaculum sp. 352 TaxID=2490946 RepID=UPI000FA7DF5D
MVRPSIHLDLGNSDDADRRDGRTDTPLSGTVIGVDEETGKVEVRFDGAPEGETVLVSADGVTAEGGRVRVLRDTAGRGVQAVTVSTPEDAVLVPMGATGHALVKIGQDLTDAQAQLEAAGALRDTKIAQAEEALRQAGETLEAVKAGDIEPTAELWLKLLQVAGNATI